MKKLIFLLSFCLLILSSFAQNSQSNVTDTTCFCCSGFYNLPVPKISGPTTVNCGDNPKYSIKACPGAVISWGISPSAIFSGNGTNTITLASPLPVPFYTVTVHIKCGNREAVSSITTKVNTVQNCTAAFNIVVKQLVNGSINIDAIPLSTAGAEHYWGIAYNGIYPNCISPCTPISFNDVYNKLTYGSHTTSTGLFSPWGLGSGITGGTATPWGINYSGFPNNCCFKITHYIKCCGIWVRQTQCVSIGTSNARTSTGVAPSVIKSEIENVDMKEIPKELFQAEKLREENDK